MHALLDLMALAGMIKAATRLYFTLCEEYSNVFIKVRLVDRSKKRRR